jgi:hypothetical protein
MTEWLSYSLTDVLMFSEDTYFRLFELHNRAAWPAQAAVLAAAVAVFCLAVRGGPVAGRLLCALFAAFWLACAWSFHLERYASINLAAPFFAAAFALQSVLLLWIGVIRGRVAVARAPPAARLAVLAVLVVAFLVYPLLAPLSGRPWLQAEIVGLAPDPTAAAALALVPLAAGRVPWVLLAIPTAWALLSGAMLWSLGSGQAVVLPGLAVLVLIATPWLRRAGRGRPG